MMETLSLQCRCYFKEKSKKKKEFKKNCLSDFFGWYLLGSWMMCPWNWKLKCDCRNRIFFLSSSAFCQKQMHLLIDLPVEKHKAILQISTPNQKQKVKAKQQRACSRIINFFMQLCFSNKLLFLKVLFKLEKKFSTLKQFWNGRK